MAELEMDSDLRARVVTLERQSNAQDGRVTAIEQGAAAREQRLVIVENWQRQQEVLEARRDEKWNHLDARFNSLDVKINKIGDTLSWVNRLIIGGIIMAVVAYMVGGGFNL